jgi:hypothetical protein
MEDLQDQKDWMREVEEEEQILGGQTHHSRNPKPAAEPAQ